MKMAVRIRTRRYSKSRTLAQISGVTDDKLEEFARDVVTRARENISNMPWDETTGELSREIYSVRLGQSHHRVETRSGHASFIEWGTRYIEGKRPFLWPAYRSVKKRFLSAFSKWV